MDIPTPRFGMERGGYAVEDVDALLNQFFSVLEANPTALTGAGLLGVRFRSIPVRPGYSPAQVDRWIETVASQLDNRGVPSSQSGYESGSTETTVQAPTVYESTPTPLPAPYVEADRGFDLPSELIASVTGPSAQLDPANDPGRNAVKELPATPPWLSLTILVVLVALMALVTYAYFR